MAQEEDEFVVIEAVRAEIDDVFESYMASGRGMDRLAMAETGVRRLLALGQDAVPYLVAEFEQERLATYDFCAYALGRIGGEEARESLRKMVGRADDQPGDAAEALKKSAVWGLLLSGDVSAIDTIFTGRHHVAAQSVHRNTSLVESAAILTAPESLDYLIKWMKELEGDEERWRERRMIMNALDRLAAPESIPLMTRTLLKGADNDRRYAATALRGLDAPESVKALIAVLDDERYAVRRTASRALAEIVAPAARQKATERLAGEEDIFVRGSLYRLLAELDGPGTLATLLAYAGKEDLRDRRFLVIAISQLGDPAALPALGEFLTDPSNSVALEAAMQLRRIGNEPSLAVLASRLSEMSPMVAQSSATFLADAGYEASAKPIAERLKAIVDARSTDRESLRAAEHLADALVELGHDQALPMLQAAIDGESPRQLQRRLEPRVEKLALIKRNGKKLRRWLDAADTEDVEHRRFVYRRIGKLSNAAAARALVAAFEEADTESRIAIVDGLAFTPAEEAEPLFRRILTDEEFDGYRLRPLRDATGGAPGVSVVTRWSTC